MSFNPQPLAIHCWCDQTFDYYAADESTDDGIRVRAYGYSYMAQIVTENTSSAGTDTWSFLSVH